MKKIAQFIFLLTLSFGLKAQTEVSFSFQAHQDDWQLFMSSKIVSDLNSGGKVVFVTLTAGDAGNGAGGYGSPTAFYVARENGAVYSCKYAADLSGGIPLVNPLPTTATVNGHSIVKYVYKNTVNYFLRLPDGGGNGDGNVITGLNSLRKLKEGTISSITSVEGLNTYNGWSDLTNTIKQIITIERGTDSQVWINTPSLNTSFNPGDHSDHSFTAVAAQDATVDSLWVGINEFADYASASLPANLNESDHANAAAIFGVSVWGLMESKYSAPFDDGHKSWFPMDHFLVKRVPSGNASNSFGFAASGQVEKNATKTFASNTSDNSALTEIPMVLSLNKPTVAANDIKFVISPYEAGQLTTAVFDKAGNKVYEMNTKIENRNALLVTLEKAVKAPGNYIVKNILNDKYIESRKIVVQ